MPNLKKYCQNFSKSLLDGYWYKNASFEKNAKIII
jgi:hypothetical protein